MILGLHGKMGAGKNTAAARIALYSPLPVVEVSYAAKLKESAAALLGCTVEHLEAWKNDERVQIIVCDHIGPMFYEGQTARAFLQRYGTEAHRDVFGEDFWLDAALPRDRDYSRALYVVTDVRFPNEAQRVRDLGGMVVKIIGPRSDTGAHRSEQDLDCDYTINNIVRTDGFRALDGQVRDLLLLALGGSVKAA